MLIYLFYGICVYCQKSDRSCQSLKKNLRELISMDYTEVDVIWDASTVLPPLKIGINSSDLILPVQAPSPGYGINPGV